MAPERGRRVLIDGRSGSGKTELAAMLTARVPGVQLVRLDDIYPGWDGLEAGSGHVWESVLSDRPRWRQWDWGVGAPARWHDLDPFRPTVVEGCGALSRRSRELADVGVWVALDDATRRVRALARDGGAYEPHWDRWARQEEAFLAREDPRRLADRIVDGRTFGSLATAADELAAWLAPRIG